LTLRILANAITRGESDGLQHECDIGITDELHMLAIFTQQACSAAVMAWPEVTQAASGCPKRTKTTAAAATCVAFFMSCDAYILHSNHVGKVLFPL